MRERAVDFIKEMGDAGLSESEVDWMLGKARVLVGDVEPVEGFGKGCGCEGVTCPEREALGM